MMNELQTFEPAFDFEHRIFGNIEGIIMEKDRRCLAAQNERQNWDIAQLKANNNTAKMEIWPIRQGVLDGHSSTSERNFLNEIAHGGNVLADIELIEFMDRVDSRRADSWKRTFEKLYSISFADRRLVTGDSVEIYNIYGTIRSVRPWTTDTSVNHTDAIRWCEELLHGWMRRGNDHRFWDVETTRHLVEEVRFYYRTKLFGY